MAESIRKHSLPDLFIVAGEDRSGDPVREDTHDREMAGRWADGINRRGGSVRIERHEYKANRAAWVYAETVQE